MNNTYIVHPFAAYYAVAMQKSEVLKLVVKKRQLTRNCCLIPQQVFGAQGPVKSIRQSDATFSSE